MTKLCTVGLYLQKTHSLQRSADWKNTNPNSLHVTFNICKFSLLTNKIRILSKYHYCVKVNILGRKADIARLLAITTTSKCVEELFFKIVCYSIDQYVAMIYNGTCTVQYVCISLSWVKTTSSAYQQCILYLYIQYHISPSTEVPQVWDKSYTCTLMSRAHKTTGCLVH